MYVVNQKTHVINKWEDTEINRLRLLSGKYNVIEYTGETETVDGVMYEKGFAPQRPLEEARTEKLAELERAFNTASQKAHCTSSAGFEIDADEIANRNIEGLVLVMRPEETTLFRAYDNTFHEVTREQLEIMRKEIVINSQYLYQAKWTIEAQIMQAQTAQAVADIDVSADVIAALAATLKAQAMEAANGNDDMGTSDAINATTNKVYL